MKDGRNTPYVHLESLPEVPSRGLGKDFCVDCHIPSNLVVIHDSVDDF